MTEVVSVILQVLILTLPLVLYRNIATLQKLHMLRSIKKSLIGSIVID